MDQTTTKPVDVRESLVDALRLDLVGPDEDLGDPEEVLAQTPSRWYLTGFLVPTEADDGQRTDPESSGTMDEMVEAGGADDAVASRVRVKTLMGEFPIASSRQERKKPCRLCVSARCALRAAVFLACLNVARF